MNQRGTVPFSDAPRLPASAVFLSLLLALWAIPACSMVAARGAEQSPAATPAPASASAAPTAPTPPTDRRLLGAGAARDRDLPPRPATESGIPVSEDLSIRNDRSFFSVELLRMPAHDEWQYLLIFPAAVFVVMTLLVLYVRRGALQQLRAVQKQAAGLTAELENQTRFQTNLTEALPDPFFIMGRNFSIVYANQAARSRYDVLPALSGKHFCFRTLKPVDGPCVDCQCPLHEAIYFSRCSRRVVQIPTTGDPDGGSHPAEIIAIPSTADQSGNICILVIDRFVNGENHPNADTRVQLLSALAEATRFILSRPENIEVGLSQALETIVTAARADAASIYELLPCEGGQTLGQLRYRWNAQPLPQLSNPEQQEYLAFGELAGSLCNVDGVVLRQTDSDLPLGLRRHLARTDTALCLLTPVYQKNELWGVLKIDIRSAQRQLQTGEITDLKTIATQLGMLITLLRADRDLREGKSQLRQRMEELETAEQNTRAAKNAAELIADELRNTLAASERLREEAIAARKEAEQMGLAATAANSAKSEFLANMSHEIRTPMNAVIGMTDVLLTTPMNDEQRDYALTVRRAGETLLSLINDILDISKMEAGKLALDPRPFRFPELLENAVELLGAQASEKGLELFVDCAPEIPSLLIGDELRLKQIVSNLLSNAVKFTRTGHVCCTANLLRPYAHGEENVSLEVVVQDTGIGMDENTLRHIFEKFTQADLSITREFGGSGLGLSICARLAHLMGGTITVESVPGNGATFCLRVELPVAQESELVLVPRLDGLHVLICGSSAPARQILARMLTPAGAACLKAASASEAMMILRGQLAQANVAVLIDERLPDLSPEALAERVASLSPSGQFIPVILSIRRDPAFRRFKGFLLKPVSRRQMIALLGRLMRGENGHLPQAQLPSTSLPRLQGQVLLVEDNPLNQRISGVMLARLGCDYRIAGNGREALEVLHEQTFDLILMDMQMPVMDGLETARRIRTCTQDFARVPIVAMTANAFGEDRQHCLEAGMNDFLPKPVTLGSLATKLAAFLPVRGCEDSAAPAAAPELPGHTLLANADAQATTDSFLSPELEPDANDETDMERFNYSQALAHTGDDPELLREALEIFRTSSQEQYTGLRLALASADRDTAVRLAHTLKGAAATFGADRASHEARLVEQFCRTEDLSQCRPEAIQTELTAFWDAVARFVWPQKQG